MAAAVDFDTFLAKYVTTNVLPGSVNYDHEFLVKDLLGELTTVNKKTFSKLGLPILVAISCAMKRSDLVPLLFQATVEASDGSEVSLLNLFRHFRETINIIWPFVGVPQVVPAAFGLAGYLQSRGFEELEDNRQRDDISKEDIQLGADTRTTIYQASANNEVFEMLTTYHGDFAYALNTVGFGYNLGRMPSKDFSLPEAELILTSALIALNATRQAGSHIKACIAFGYSEGDLRAVADAAEKFASWQGLKLSPIDIQQLHRQARAVMESL